MSERKTIGRNEQVSEELLGVKVYFTDGLVSGLESADGKKTSVTYVRANGKVKYQAGIPLVDELVLSDGSKFKRDPQSGDYLDIQGRALFESPVAHIPSGCDNQSFIRYRDTLGNPHTIFASRGDVLGPSLPIDRGLLVNLWLKNLPRADRDKDQEISLTELVKAVEDPSITGLDAVFFATLKRDFSTISWLDKKLAVSNKDIERLDRSFQNFRLGSRDKPWGFASDLDHVLNSWVTFQNKAKFVTSKLYAHGPKDSIRPEYVLQGDAGNCYWQSSLMTVAKIAPDLIFDMVKKDRQGNWRVLFPQSRHSNDVITVKPLTETEQLLYSGAAGGGQWAGVLEKAMAQYREKDSLANHGKCREEKQTWQDFTDGGVQQRMLGLLTDRTFKDETPHSTSLEKLHELLTNAVTQKLPMGAGMDKPKVKGLHGNHSYAILDYNPQTRDVTLFDPNHCFEPKDKKGRDRDRRKDGTFTISLAEFKACCDQFNYLDKHVEKSKFVTPPMKKTRLLSDSNIVKEKGEVVMATQEEAIALCKKLGGHLPTTRELAETMNPDGILEANFVEEELDGKVPEGYYKVECENEGGEKDVFYYTNNDSFKLGGEVAKLSFWTSSKVLGNPEYGHVFYGWLGGGRPSKEDHAIGYKHAVLIVRSESESDSVKNK